MTLDASDEGLAVDAVVLCGVGCVIEGDLAPLVIDAVSVQLDLRRLFFAFLRDLLRSRAERRVANNGDSDETQDHNQDFNRLHSLLFLPRVADLMNANDNCQ